MQKAVIVTPFDNYSYDVRIKYIEMYLKDLGYNCIVISADFDHRNKKHYYCKRENLELLHVPEYKYNMSIKRVYSHYVFAKSVKSRLEELKPDLLYVSGPPNFLFKYASKYKQLHRNVKLIYEIGDLWPESLPIKHVFVRLLKPILLIWKYLRDSNLKYADAIIYECEMFRKRISSCHNDVKCKTIYLCKEDYFKESFVEYNDESIMRIAYIGSINNIIDINLIVDILDELNKRVNIEFVIIGDGENKKSLLDSCNINKIKYKDYGIVYDDQKKFNILSRCQFGLNIMRQNIAVGATMKSLEYLHWGLILINNISADTMELVEEYNCGVNINKDNKDEYIDMIDYIANLSINDIKRLRNNSRRLFLSKFEENRIREEYYSLLRNI